MADTPFRGTHTHDLERGVNLARTMAARWFSFVQKLGSAMLITVFVTIGPINKHFLSAYSAPGVAWCSPQGHRVNQSLEGERYQAGSVQLVNREGGSTG